MPPPNIPDNDLFDFFPSAVMHFFRLQVYTHNVELSPLEAECEEGILNFVQALIDDFYPTLKSFASVTNAESLSNEQSDTLKYFLQDYLPDVNEALQNENLAPLEPQFHIKNMGSRHATLIAAFYKRYHPEPFVKDNIPALNQFVIDNIASLNALCQEKDLPNIPLIVHPKRNISKKQWPTVKRIFVEKYGDVVRAHNNAFCAHAWELLIRLSKHLFEHPPYTLRTKTIYRYFVMSCILAAIHQDEEDILPSDFKNTLAKGWKDAFQPAALYQVQRHALHILRHRLGPHYAFHKFPERTLSERCLEMCVFEKKAGEYLFKPLPHQETKILEQELKQVITTQYQMYTERFTPKPETLVADEENTQKRKLNS